MFIYYFPCCVKYLLWHVFLSSVIILGFIQKRSHLKKCPIMMDDLYIPLAALKFKNNNKKNEIELIETV